MNRSSDTRGAPRRTQDTSVAVKAPGSPRVLEIPSALTVKELSDLCGVSPVEVIKELMKNGVMAAVNQVIDYETAAIVATDLGFEPREAAPPVVRRGTVEAARRRIETEEEDPSKLKPRPPVITVMGHVDHGKTSILDAIRHTNVTAQEAGGITQHIGAYQVEVNGQKLTFIDTPGHEAFTAMRARGAQVTDIAVLVVAADDGVMPQTIEAINHAKAAGVPIVVAINKIDLPDANPERVKQQLAEHDLLIEEWGGDVICVPVSARTGEGLQDLLENLLVLAEVLELRANPDRPAAGVVLEAELDTQRGPMATLLVQAGTLGLGDALVVGETWGKVKAMFDERGRRVTEAGPSVPVAVLGLAAVPLAGDLFQVVQDERTARAIIEERQRQAEIEAQSREQHPLSLETLFGEITAGRVKELNIVLKADVQGSVEAIKQALERLSNEQVRVKIIHSGTGAVTESDVMLATASNGIVIGFNTRTDPGARRLAEVEGVEIRLYRIIYELIEDIEKSLKGLLEPVYRDVIDGHAEVRQVFKIRRGNIAGCIVRDGTITRGAMARVIRGGEILYEGRIDSLRRFQEDVREVAAGYECGLHVENFDDYQEGDVIETYHRERQG